MNDHDELNWYFDADNDAPPREPETDDSAATVKLTIAPWFVALGTSKPKATTKGDAA